MSALLSVRRPLLFATATLLLGSAAASAQAETPAQQKQAMPAIATWEVEGAFEDVLQDVEDAIVGQGLKITYRADIAGMLARTGKDLGFEPLYRGGQVLQFCSARLSYEAMKADAANIAFCPYGIFVFQTVQKPDKVSVGFRPLPVPAGISAESKKAREAINALLKGIVAEAVGE